MSSPPPTSTPENPQGSSSNIPSRVSELRDDRNADSDDTSSEDILLARRLSSPAIQAGTRFGADSSTSDENADPGPRYQSIIPGSSPDDSPVEAELPRKEPDCRKCWICYTDEMEDSSLNAEWRSPCPCALSAHESCLLDWLADMENTENYNRHKDGATILCPQCKSEIRMSRPQSLILDTMRSLESTLGRMVLPGAVFTITGAVWAGCCAHGIYSMYFVFGRDHAIHILEEAAQTPWSPGLNIGLPLIPISLIFARTRYSERLLPAIPIIFFSAHHPQFQDIDGPIWPPSPAITFAALPYVKSLYSLLYKKLFGKLERQWISTVRTRLNFEDDEQGPQEEEQDAAVEREQGELVMQIELQVGADDDEEEEDEQIVQAIEEEVAQVNGPPAGQVLARRQADVLRESTNLADLVLGALVFPVISAGMGGLLKLALPKAWTSTPVLFDRARPSLLQTRWGRSVIGGCVFVLLKDAITLYCRYKQARLHSQRVILNYDKRKKRPVLP